MKINETAAFIPDIQWDKRLHLVISYKLFEDKLIINKLSSAFLYKNDQYLVQLRKAYSFFVEIVLSNAATQKGVILP